MSSHPPVYSGLSNSMRRNYEELGVEQYYTMVGSTYRNPHLPGVRRCLFTWLDRWWQMEHLNLDQGFVFFDMAAGSGEATSSFVEWWDTRHVLYAISRPSSDCAECRENPDRPETDAPSALHSPRIIAADPYTATAFHKRTSLPCASMSFCDIAEDMLYEAVSPTSPLEMTVCSFALHLIETPSEIFSLLWELSTKSRWLVVLAPHKKPEIKEGWGWVKWDVVSWERCPMNNRQGEILQDRVHCRIYRSTNI